ncbi:MAG: SDR family NAD(P)-dependent oxidoreductase [Alphaproteobacteria bacterium]|jgi:glucose 1-dehydrogenase|nr:SDR family NAD(P)-dependent oxidoreductase [Alphaproteobacteria bacterium]
MRILITGGSRGIGGAVARRVARDAAKDGGLARIALCDREGIETLGPMTAELESIGAEVLPLTGDLAEVETPERLLRAAVAAFGGLDALFSNAGITRPEKFAEMDVATWELMMNVNLRATWLLAKAAYPALKESRGAIVATASTAGVMPYRNMGAYSTTKAALIMLTAQLAQEWGPDGIRVNCLSPGAVHTPLSARVYADNRVKAAREALVPLGYIGDPTEDLAGVVAFLLSKDAQYVTGQNVLADGGLAASICNHIPGLSEAAD